VISQSLSPANDWIKIFECDQQAGEHGPAPVADADVAVQSNVFPMIQYPKQKGDVP
jgi:hypothetical protein